VRPSSPGYRGFLNWFGAAFGIAVLVGAAFLYLTARADQSTAVTATVADTLPAVTLPAESEFDQQLEPSPGGDGQLSESTTGVLFALYVVDSLEVHDLEQAYAAATQVDQDHVDRMLSALAALETVQWPTELDELAAELRTRMAGLLEAMEGQDLERTRHALEEVHEAEHLLASGIYAWLAGTPMATPMAAHEEENEGGPIDAADAGVFEIGMFEFGYEPGIIDIEAGVPVVFRFTNTGKLTHEAMVGDAHMQEEFAAAGDHDDGQQGDDHHGNLMAILVQPGETKDLVVLIDQPGTWYVACHLIGHYEKGQIATINVTG
jgi:uncharacterized cupredoxin-like copper-binding protein